MVRVVSGLREYLSQPDDAEEIARASAVTRLHLERNDPTVPMGPRPEAAIRRRRNLAEMEARMREQGTIGCRCLCAVLHPAEHGICTGAAERNVLLRKEGNVTVAVAMCAACVAAQGAGR